MLRRTLDDRPHHGPLLRFDMLGSLALDRRTYPLWRPLLLLSLFENSVLQLWARYQIEPGRRIDKLFDDVEWEVWTPDGVTDIEQPRTGDFGEDADLPTMRRFLSELASRMPEDFSNLARLVIGDPTPDGALREVADQALLFQEILERRIRQPLNEFSERVRDE